MNIHYFLWYLVLAILLLSGIYNFYSAYKVRKWQKEADRQLASVLDEIMDFMAEERKVGE